MGTTIAAVALLAAGLVAAQFPEWTPRPYEPDLRLNITLPLSFPMLDLGYSQGIASVGWKEVNNSSRGPYGSAVSCNATSTAKCSMYAEGVLLGIGLQGDIHGLGSGSVEEVMTMSLDLNNLAQIPSDSGGEFSYYNGALNKTFHRVVMHVSDSLKGTLDISSVNYTYGIYSAAPTIDDVPKVTVSFVNKNGTFNEEAGTVTDGQSGKMSISTEYGRGGETTQYSTVQLTNTSLEFDIPANTSFVMLNGTTGPESGNFYLHLSHPPPGYEPFDLRSEVWFSPWYSATRVYTTSGPLFTMVLDPLFKYNGTIFSEPGSGNGSVTLGLHSITFYSSLYDGPKNTDSNPTDSNPRPKGKTNVGAIAGGVVGGVVGAGLILALLIFLCCRRRRSSRRPQQVGREPKLNLGDATSLNPYRPRNSEMLALPPKDSLCTDSPPAQTEHVEYQQPHVPQTETPRQPPQLALNTQNSGGYANYLLSPLVVEGQGLPNSPLTPKTPKTPATPATPSAPRRHRIPRRRVEQEIDGGSVDDEVERVPPVYNPQWADRRGTQ